MSSTSLFVGGIPYSIKEDDFKTVFQDQEGFVSSRLSTDKNDNTIGFVEFTTPEQALAAKEKFQGHKIDEIQDAGFTIQFAYTKNNRRRNDNNRRNNNRQYNNGNFGNQNYANMMQPPNLPSNASSTLYVEGIPSDATEREVGHIFRPFPGFQTVRLLKRESTQYPNKTFHLCFIEFDNKYQATCAMNTVQGYRMDLNDYRSLGLSISFARSERRRRRYNNSDSDSKEENEDGNTNISDDENNEESA